MDQVTCLFDVFIVYIYRCELQAKFGACRRDILKVGCTLLSVLQCTLDDKPSSGYPFGFLVLGWLPMLEILPRDPVEMVS